MCFPCAIVMHQVPFLICKLKAYLIAKPPFTKPPYVNSRLLPVSAKKTLLRKRTRLVMLALRAPHPGLDCSLCRSSSSSSSTTTTTTNNNNSNKDNNSNNNHNCNHHDNNNHNNDNDNNAPARWPSECRARACAKGLQIDQILSFKTHRYFSASTTSSGFSPFATQVNTHLDLIAND